MRVHDHNTDFEFENNVGYRIKPEEKFASYERARVKEALTKVRHVEKSDEMGVKVESNGTVYFEGKRYSTSQKYMSKIPRNVIFSESKK